MPKQECAVQQWPRSQRCSTASITIQHDRPTINVERFCARACARIVGVFNQERRNVCRCSRVELRKEFNKHANTDSHGTFIIVLNATFVVATVAGEWLHVLVDGVCWCAIADAHRPHAPHIIVNYPLNPCSVRRLHDVCTANIHMHPDAICA